LSHHEVELKLIMQRWERVRDTHPTARDHLHRDLFPSQHTIAAYRREHIMHKIGGLKKLLHGRQRRRMRLAMSDRVREMETMLATRKLGQLIQKLLDFSEHDLVRCQASFSAGDSGLD
jgi:hypothetical protein